MVISDIARSPVLPRRTLPLGPGRVKPDARVTSPALLSLAAMRILFVTSNRLGDAVLSTGLLDHLLRTHPEARFTVACGPVAEGVFERMPNRERTIVLDKQPWRLHWHGLWVDTVTMWWDLVVDIRGSVF